MPAMTGLLNKYRQQFFGLPDQIQLMPNEKFGLQSPRAKKWIASTRIGMIDGDVENGCIGCGQGIGLINDIPTVAEVIKRMMEGVGPALDRANAIVHN